ncbi:hypothetical protein RJ639_026906 [Escallonia herrerae]|uniref:Uncharacterized protein n=1 Tax=Escallonia herrerae TaxID=1293975 RepID=A0AA88X7R1_9ASTE|nr:hypothetical protein RJ639_026906 [Escallonia herrerae]
MALKEKTVERILQKLSGIAKDGVNLFKKNVSRGLELNPHNWPVKVIAANSMYRITQTILLDCQGSHKQTDEELFHKLSVMIADLLGACLTNLLHAMTMNIQPLFVASESADYKAGISLRGRHVGA